MKILHMTLLRKWFYLIASGEKKNEYRENTKYWQSRLLDDEGYAIEFDEIHFRNGYRKDAPFMRAEWKGCSLWRGEDFTGKHGEIIKYGTFSIHIGKILEVKV